MDIAGVLPALADFRSVKRRLEVIGSARGITVYDDFAHHPTAIATTLDGGALGEREEVPVASAVLGALLAAAFDLALRRDDALRRGVIERREPPVERLGDGAQPVRDRLPVLVAVGRHEVEDVAQRLQRRGDDVELGEVEAGRRTRCRFADDGEPGQPLPVRAGRRDRGHARHLLEGAREASGAPFVRRHDEGSGRPGREVLGDDLEPGRRLGGGAEGVGLAQTHPGAEQAGGEHREHDQAGAEEWLSQNYLELTELGVDYVTLYEEDRLVYGPMSLAEQ